MNSLPSAHAPCSSTLRFRQKHAPFRYLSSGDLVHDRLLSPQQVDEVIGELTTRVVCRLDLAPVRRYLLRGIDRIAYEQFPDRCKRQVELTQHRHEARRFELRDVVVAIARGFVDARGHQHTELVVETQRLD